MVTSFPQKYSVQISNPWADPPHVSLSPAQPRCAHSEAGSCLDSILCGWKWSRGLSVGVDLHDNHDHLRETTWGQKRKWAFSPQLPFYGGGQKNFFWKSVGPFINLHFLVSRGGKCRQRGRLNVALASCEVQQNTGSCSLSSLDSGLPGQERVSPAPVFHPHGAARLCEDASGHRLENTEQLAVATSGSGHMNQLSGCWRFIFLKSQFIQGGTSSHSVPD